eukprot:7659597-Pyramimonas_sp.AAC.1
MMKAEGSEPPNGCLARDIRTVWGQRGERPHPWRLPLVVPDRCALRIAVIMRSQRREHQWVR